MTTANRFAQEDNSCILLPAEEAKSVYGLKVLIAQGSDE